MKKKGTYTKTQNHSLCYYIPTFLFLPKPQHTYFMQAIDVVLFALPKENKPSARMRSEGYGTWSVCLSVRRLANLAVQGMGRPMTATNRFRVARSLILIGRFS